MIYDEKAKKQVTNVFDFILITAERCREINIQRNSTELSKSINSKSSNFEFAHEQAVREIGQGTIGREYLGKVKSRKYKTKMR